MIGRRIHRAEWVGANSDGGREGCAARTGTVVRVEDGVAWIAWDGSAVQGTVLVSCIDRIEGERVQP